MKNEPKWFSSKDVQKTLNIKGCKLMHYRVQNKLDFKKKAILICIPLRELKSSIL